jgi:hypothetical protein
VVEHDVGVELTVSKLPAGRDGDMATAREYVGELEDKERGVVGEDAFPIGLEPQAEQLFVIRARKMRDTKDTRGNLFYLLLTDKGLKCRSTSCARLRVSCCCSRE